MQANKILLATDFSPSCESALRFASSLARDACAELLILHVQEPPAPLVDTGLGGFAAPAEPDERRRRRQLAATVPPFSGVGHSHHLLTGDPAAEIVRFAAEQQVDLVVVGTHGRRGVPRWLMGSVAEAVVRHAACPVLTVKEPARQAAAS